MNKGKIAVLIGTRPGIIKMAPIIHQLREQNLPHYVVHTGQHYSHEMDRKIMIDVELAEPEYLITRPTDCISHAEQTAYMLVEIEKILQEDRPEVLLVCGDANTNLAGALAARKIHIKVGHVEAGLRSYDWRMPEEHNRIIIDHISEYLFAPTLEAQKNLCKDGVQGEVFVVGNTIVDATLKHSKKASLTKNTVVKEIISGESYILLTLHREENVDSPIILKSILTAIEQISQSGKFKVIFPVHPRTRKRFTEFNMNKWLDSLKYLQIIDPLGYLDFLAVLNNAKLVMSDSGGIQEEACILKIPCLTLRDNTERPETVAVGANRIAGASTESIVEAFSEVEISGFTIPEKDNPFGDGQTARRIVETCIYGQPKDQLI